MKTKKETPHRESSLEEKYKIDPVLTDSKTNRSTSPNLSQKVKLIPPTPWSAKKHINSRAERISELEEELQKNKEIIKILEARVKQQQEDIDVISSQLNNQIQKEARMALVTSNASSKIEALKQQYKEDKKEKENTLTTSVSSTTSTESQWVNEAIDELEKLQQAFTTELDNTPPPLPSLQLQKIKAAQQAILSQINNPEVIMKFLTYGSLLGEIEQEIQKTIKIVIEEGNKVAIFTICYCDNATAENNLVLSPILVRRIDNKVELLCHNQDFHSKEYWEYLKFIEKAISPYEPSQIVGIEKHNLKLGHITTPEIFIVLTNHTKLEFSYHYGYELLRDVDQGKFTLQDLLTKLTHYIGSTIKVEHIIKTLSEKNAFPSQQNANKETHTKTHVDLKDCRTISEILTHLQSELQMSNSSNYNASNNHSDLTIGASLSSNSIDTVYNSAISSSSSNNSVNTIVSGSASFLGSDSISTTSLLGTRNSDITDG